MSPPLVSILIPCFNAERWLAETVESALAQTWPNKELIIVNDGSNDDSLTVARSFESRGVRVIDQPNRGASAARNRALTGARGEFIQFLDADDLLSPDKIAAQITRLQSVPFGRVATCAWNRFTTDVTPAHLADTEVCHDFTPVEFLVLAGNTGAMMHPSAWLVPRTTANRAGPWDESLTLNDDGEYFARVALASSGLSFTPIGRSFYRSGLPGSLSQRRDERARRSQFHSIELITRHLLAAEDSIRTRRAAANYHQRFIHDFFPSPPDLMTLAEEHIATLGGSTLGPPPMGPRTAALARVLGWRTVWRLKHLLNR